MHPFINIFGLKLPSYGLMMATALIVAIIVSYIRVKRAKLDLDIFSNLAIIAILAGLASAYLLYIFVTYSIQEIFESIANGSFSVFKSGGLVFYGSIIGGVLAALIYLKAKKQKFFDYAAAIVPSIPLAHAIGRVGCFLAGCCYGQCVDTPLSVIYTNPIGNAPTGVPVFPIQLVESACNIVVFIILILYTAKNMKKRSVLFLYMILYGIERFVLEFFRGDLERGVANGLSTSQWISIAIVLGGILGFILLFTYEQKHKNDPPEEEPEEESDKAEEPKDETTEDGPAEETEPAE